MTGKWKLTSDFNKNLNVLQRNVTESRIPMTYNYNIQNIIQNYPIHKNF